MGHPRIRKGPTRGGGCCGPHKINRPLQKVRKRKALIPRRGFVTFLRLLTYSVVAIRRIPVTSTTELQSHRIEFCKKRQNDGTTVFHYPKCWHWGPFRLSRAGIFPKLWQLHLHSFCSAAAYKLCDPSRAINRSSVARVHRRCRLQTLFQSALQVLWRRCSAMKCKRRTRRAGRFICRASVASVHRFYWPPHHRFLKQSSHPPKTQGDGSWTALVGLTVPK